MSAQLHPVPPYNPDVFTEARMLRAETPPEVTTGPHKYLDLIDELRAVSPEWWIVVERRAGGPNAVRSVVQALQRRGCKTRTRTYDNRWTSVWACWPGEVDG